MKGTKSGMCTRWAKMAAARRSTRRVEAKPFGTTVHLQVRRVEPNNNAAARTAGSGSAPPWGYTGPKASLSPTTDTSLGEPAAIIGTIGFQPPGLCGHWIDEILHEKAGVFLQRSKVFLHGVKRRAAGQHHQGG